MMEVWKAIPGFDNYEASNTGKIRGIDRYINHPAGGKRLWKGKEIRPQSDRPKVSLRQNGKTFQVRVSILIAMAFLNHNPNGFHIVVDHINNDQTDNRLENLQLINNRENSTKDKWRHNGTSKYIGVSWNKACQKWRSHIRINKKQIYLGSFDTEIEASNAYKKALDGHINNETV